jgi:hypothetical protein
MSCEHYTEELKIETGNQVTDITYIRTCEGWLSLPS